MNYLFFYDKLKDIEICNKYFKVNKYINGYIKIEHSENKNLKMYGLIAYVDNKIDEIINIFINIDSQNRKKKLDQIICYDIDTNKEYICLFVI
tara:strand:+ start:1886 stop:2164 length:279 start_codon:yes stop_codon:yes gene_type:complete